MISADVIVEVRGGNIVEVYSDIPNAQILVID